MTTVCLKARPPDRGHMLKYWFGAADVGRMRGRPFTRLPILSVLLGVTGSVSAVHAAARPVHRTAVTPTTTAKVPSARQGALLHLRADVRSGLAADGSWYTDHDGHYLAETISKRAGHPLPSKDRLVQQGLSLHDGTTLRFHPFTGEDGDRDLCITAVSTQVPTVVYGTSATDSLTLSRAQGCLKPGKP